MSDHQCVRIQHIVYVSVGNKLQPDFGCGALDRLKARGATTGIKVELLVSDEERRSFGYASLSRSCNGNSKRLCYQ